MSYAEFAESILFLFLTLISDSCNRTIDCHSANLLEIVFESANGAFFFYQELCLPVDLLAHFVSCGVSL